MASNFCSKSCLVLVVIFSVVGWNSVSGQPGFEVMEARFAQLTKAVQKNTKETREQFEQIDDKIAQLVHLVKNCSKETENRLAEELSQQIQNSTSEILLFTSPCRKVESGNLLCKINSTGAGWIVIQQRLDQSVNFNRSWAEYRDGFGTVGPSTEFWWGLERVHQLTKTGRYELLVELEDDQGEFWNARYSEFAVEGESEQYRLAKLAGYSGTAGDFNAASAGDVPTGQKFSTYDRDNDGWINNCAADSGDGWWWNICGRSLNSLRSYYSTGWMDKALPYTRMLIRAKP